MALLKGRLFSGALFAGVLLSSVEIVAPPIVADVNNGNVGWTQTTWKQSTQRITIHKKKESLPSPKIDYNQQNLLAQIAQEDLMAIEVIVAFVTMEG